MRRHFALRISSLIICTLFVFSFCSCNIADQIRSNLQERISVQSEINIQEMTRLLISSINDKRNTADAYSGIPEFQKDDISYSCFCEYVNILRTISTQGSKGKVRSFRIMRDEECMALLGQDLFNRYGTIKGAELLYSSEAEYPVYVFYRTEADGSVSLSRDWIISIINIYNYGHHYFSLLEESNADGVEALLSPGLLSDVYTDEVVYARAQQLCDLYRLRVMSSSSEYEITSLLPDKMTVIIPETLVPDGTSFEDHTVTISILGNGSYLIDDNISIAPDMNLIYLVQGDERLVRAGYSYSYAQIVSLLGEPSSSATYSEDTSMMILYPGLLLRLDGAFDESGSFIGTLSSIRLIGNSAYSIGYNIFVGMSMTQILMLYPFADADDCSINFSGSLRSYSVTFDFDDNNIVESVKVST